MKKVLNVALLLMSLVVAAQQSQEPASNNAVDFDVYDFNLLGDSSFQKFQQPKIQLDGDFYTILQAPNVKRKLLLGNMPVKYPEFIPEMPLTPLNPTDDYYLLDLDPVIITSPEK